MALPTALLLCILSLTILPSPSSTNEGNVLATGDVLPTEGQLSYKDATFVIQDDCNLVLYNKAKAFEFNANVYGKNCTLTLSDYGQLVIQSGDGLNTFYSPGGSKKGKYVAVLGPNGKVNVFGPSIWSTPALSSSFATIDAELNDVPFVRNVLFSSQVLHKNSKLWSRDYSLELTHACNLKLTRASVGVLWEIKTKGKGHHCFVRLDNRGQLAIVNDRYKVLWSSKPAGAKGDYVLVVEVHGQAVIYGPVVYSIGS